MSKESSSSEEEIESQEKMTFLSRTPASKVLGKVPTAALISLLLQWTMAAVKKFWALCAAMLLILILCFWLYGSVIAFMLLLLALVGFGYNIQDRLLYYPEQPGTSRLFVDSPAVFNMPFENVFVRTSDGVRINLLLIKQPANLLGTAPTVIFFHGNAGNVGHRLLNAYALYMHCQCNVLLVEYRGYGKSSGTPSEKGIYLDAQAALDYALTRTDIDKNKLIVFGRSLGGAVAIQLASIPYYAVKINALVIENTFTTLPEIGRSIFNFKAIKVVPEWCFKNRYPSKRRISKVRVPTLFLSGSADTLIPPRMMQELYDLSGSRMKRMAKFEGGTHNETWVAQGYLEAINRFLGELEQARQMKPREAENTYSVDAPFNDGGADGSIFNL